MYTTQAVEPQLDFPNTSSIVASPARSYLKWAGGKFKVLEHLAKHIPAGQRLIEPFAGTAVVGINSTAHLGIASDLNLDLINTHRHVQNSLTDLLEACKALFTPEANSRESYNDLRDEFNSIEHGLRKSAIFIYLNRHCFNGLCRYNKSGKFNVPFGKYKSPAIPELAMANFSKASQNIEFRSQDFRSLFEEAEVGDVIYCDPPYSPLEQVSNFTAYSGGGFGTQDQTELRDCAIRASERGIPVVISNHDTTFTRRLYSNAEQHFFGVRRAISRDASGRGAAAELVAVYQ